MEEILTFPQITLDFSVLFRLMLGATLCVLLTSSRTRPMPEVLGTVLAAHFLVLNTLLWHGYLMTGSLVQGDFFRFGLSPVLPAVSFYGGLIAIALPVTCLVVSLVRRRRYRIRQLAAHTIAAVLVSVGLWTSIRAPIAYQAAVDAYGMPAEMLTPPQR